MRLYGIFVRGLSVVSVVIVRGLRGWWEGFDVDRVQPAVAGSQMNVDLFTP